MMLIQKVASEQEKVASKYIARETVRKMREMFRHLRAKAGKPKKGALEKFMTPEGVKRVKRREAHRVMKFRKKPGTQLIGGKA